MLWRGRRESGNVDDRLRQRLNEEEYNKYSVKLELQADFFCWCVGTLCSTNAKQP